MKRPAILFVCLGNICRSPLAEAAFREAAAKAGLSCEIDSAGTGDWHVGLPPDERAQSTALENGLDIGHYRARQVTVDDFDDFDHIVAMDSQNHASLRAIAPRQARAQLSMLLDHVEGQEGQSVADPYVGNSDDFRRCWETVSLGAAALAQKLRNKHSV